MNALLPLGSHNSWSHLRVLRCKWGSPDTCSKNKPIYRKNFDYNESESEFSWKGLNDHNLYKAGNGQTDEQTERMKTWVIYPPVVQRVTAQSISEEKVQKQKHWRPLNDFQSTIS